MIFQEEWENVIAHTPTNTRKIFLKKRIVGQSRKNEAEELHTHFGSVICLQPPLWSKSLNTISKDHSFAMNDPCVGPYDCLSRSQ